MDKIRSFIKIHFQELKKKDNTLKTEEDAVEHLMNISLFHIKWKPKLFDWKRYIQTYPDLRKSLRTISDAIWHYLLYGIRERRRVYILGSDEFYKHQFNWKDYITINQDLRFVTTDMDALRHYIEIGHSQNRQTTIKEQSVINDRIEITDNQVINHQWIQLLTRYLSIITKVFKSVLVCSHSNLAYTAGDTIMLSNCINKFMSEGNNVTILSKYHVPMEFLVNLQYNNYEIITLETNYNIIKYIDNNEENFDMMFIRNHEVLDMLQNKPYLNKIVFYGLDVHIDGLSKMNNQFQKVVTQSEELKSKYVKSGIVDSKIEVQEPFVFKYDFNIPPRNDKEIRLIYCGTLRDEENILEIIEEFQTIHEKRPEVVLKIVYGKIFNSSQNFTNKINNYIKQGVKGITFKYNLSHHDSCYEIATSDIGICWRKNGWGENGEVSTKVKEYEMYGVCVLKISPYKLFTFENINFVLNNRHNGYAKRTEYMNLESTLVLINPVHNKNLNNYIEFKNNIFVGYLSVKFLNNCFFKNVNNIIISSNYGNFTTMYPIAKTMNTSIIYDIRGLWYLSRKAHIESGADTIVRRFSETDYQSEEDKEIECIKNSDKIIYISNSCYMYLQRKYNIIKRHLIFPNCISNDECLNIMPRQKNRPLRICYFGSIVPYEGLHNLINVCAKLVQNKIDIKLIIIGKVSVYRKFNINYNFIEKYEWLEKKELNKVLSNTHLVCLPRINSDACRLIPPLKVAECISRKLPLLTPDYEIFKEISDNGKLFNLYKDGELYNEIKNIYDTGYDFSKLEKAKKYYEKNMSWDLYKEKMKHFLNS